MEKIFAVHARLKEAGHESDIFVASALVDLYSKCGSLTDASLVFESMTRHDAVSWTALILGYVQGGKSRKALELFSRMLGEGLKPDARAFVVALKACANLASAEESFQEEKMVYLETHSELEKIGLVEADLFVASSLVDMYAKCGTMLDSRRVFERMKKRGVVTWNSMLMGFAQVGEARTVLDLFQQMQEQEIVPDTRTFIAVFKALANSAGKSEQGDTGDAVKSWCLDRGRALHSQMLLSKSTATSSYDTEIFLWSTLVDMYSKCGSLADAKKIFDKISKPDLVLWNAIILGCASNDESELALELFYLLEQQEDRRLQPDDGTFVAALKACANLAALEIGQRIHAQVSNSGLESKPLVSTSLVDFYSKCGCMAQAREVFDAMEPAKRSSVTWNSFLAGHCRAGNHEQVFQVFESMKTARAEINGTTFLCLLNACSHAGLVHRAKEYLESMSLDYGITASMEHYACMVDILGRSNQVEAAAAMARGMPLEANRAVWMTVLSSCERLGDRETGKFAFDSIVSLNPDDAPAYVLLAKTYS